MKIFIRYIYEPEFNQREKLREHLNALGFYVLHASDGLDVYAVKDSQGYLETIWECLKNAIR